MEWGNVLKQKEEEEGEEGGESIFVPKQMNEMCCKLMCCKLQIIRQNVELRYVIYI